MTELIRDAQPDQALSELVACTLNDTDLKTQQERWLTLGENFGISRTPTDDGLRLSFRYHPQVETELRALVAVENDCCSWADWSVEPDGHDAAVVAMKSRGNGIATLHAMFTEPCFDQSRTATPEP